MNKISDDIIWRYLQGTATTEDMKALNEYISASPENKKVFVFHRGVVSSGKVEIRRRR